MNPDLSVPVWTIDHVAAALHLKVDTAREHTYTVAFPAPADGFSKNLWLREEVLDWFAALPRAERRRTDGSRARHGSTGTAAGKAVRAADLPTPTHAQPVSPARKSKPYKPRTS